MNEQILIVEDEDDTAELLRYNLQKANYRTVIARNGEEAITAVQRHMPDAVLLDIMLPELNGWEVCRILRESSQGKSIPIIMLTALADEEARIKGLALGADDYISKPFSIREVLLKIRKYVDRQQTIKQLQTREQEQDTSLRYLVHELKNTVSVIGGFSALALQKDDIKNYLKKINTSAAHAESLLNDASLLARIENKEGALPVEPLDIGALVKEVVDVLHDTAKSRNIEIVVDTGTPSLVQGNMTAVRQVLINLLSNAVKYNRKGGTVWISFEETGGWLDVSVTDEGCGIPQSELPKIFEKFYRAAGSEQVKGAGLGLYIVKLLTETMGGKITAVSHPGVGSTMTLSMRKLSVPHLNDDVKREKKAAQSV